jgi:hypothetical protein
MESARRGQAVPADRAGGHGDADDGQPKVATGVQAGKRQAGLAAPCHPHPVGAVRAAAVGGSQALSTPPDIIWTLRELPPRRTWNVKDLAKLRVR